MQVRVRREEYEAEEMKEIYEELVVYKRLEDKNVNHGRIGIAKQDDQILEKAAINRIDNKKEATTKMNRNAHFI